MKNAILGLFLTTMILSCKKQTHEKIEETTKAVGTEMHQEMDTMGEKMDKMKIKTKATLDTVKQNMGAALEKNGKKMESAGKKMKESATNK